MKPLNIQCSTIDAKSLVRFVVLLGVNSLKNLRIKSREKTDSIPIITINCFQNYSSSKVYRKAVKQKQMQLDDMFRKIIKMLKAFIVQLSAEMTSLSQNIFSSTTFGGLCLSYFTSSSSFFLLQQLKRPSSFFFFILKSLKMYLREVGFSKQSCI